MLWLQLQFQGSKRLRKTSRRKKKSSEEQNKHQATASSPAQIILRSHALDDLGSTTSSQNDTVIPITNQLEDSVAHNDFEFTRQECKEEQPHDLCLDKLSLQYEEVDQDSKYQNINTLIQKEERSLVLIQEIDSVVVEESSDEVKQQNMDKTQDCCSFQDQSDYNKQSKAQQQLVGCGEEGQGKKKWWYLWNHRRRPYCQEQPSIFSQRYEKKSWMFGFFLKQFVRAKPMDSSFLRACSEVPQELACYEDCVDFLMSMPGSAEAVGLIFQQLTEQLNSINDDFDCYLGATEEEFSDLQIEEVMWKVQQQLHALMMSGFRQIVSQWPACMPLSEDHCIAIQRSLQNIIFRRIQCEILQFLSKVYLHEDKLLWKFCCELSDMLSSDNEQVQTGIAKWHIIGDDHEDSEPSLSETDTNQQFESLVVEFDHIFEQQAYTKIEWEVDSSSHDYFLSYGNEDIACIESIEAFVYREKYDPFEFICRWLSDNHIGCEYDCSPDLYDEATSLSSKSTASSVTSSIYPDKQSRCDIGESHDLNLSGSELSESLQLTNEMLQQICNDYDLPDALKQINFQYAQEQLLQISSANCPIDIICHISKVHNCIRRALASSGRGEGLDCQVPTDDVLPVFINLVTRARFQHLATYVQYLQLSNLIGDHITSHAQMVCDLQIAKSYMQQTIKEVMGRRYVARALWFQSQCEFVNKDENMYDKCDNQGLFSELQTCLDSCEKAASLFGCKLETCVDIEDGINDMIRRQSFTKDCTTLQHESLIQNVC
eukprot:TRINITY_DN1165_c0_g2_i1.p1 TRINITY_DN1165_c0_g2~~TRINITY_DN1165_c0_g2_i1.p1  ORF type:complete len:770 (-),score=51.99 TRINITY_DN1165_c0_g2_i1:1092-3401(-)